MKGLLFTYAMTYGGAVISLFNPFYGLLIYICFAIVKPPALWHWSVPVGNYSRIIGAALIIGWAINGFGDLRMGKARSVIYAALGYYFWIILSTMFSNYPERGIPFIEYFGKTIIPVIAGVTLVRTSKQIQQLMWVLIGSAAYLAFECNLSYLQGYSIERHGFLGVDNNTFAIFVVTGFGLAVVRGLEDPDPKRRWLCLAIAAGMAHVPMLAFSRGGMLGVGVATITAAVLTPKTARTWRTFALCACIGAILAGPTVVEEFSSSFAAAEERDGSADSRVLLWTDCWDVAVKNPLVGIGQGAWMAIAHEYGWPRGKAAHSLWFQAVAELGFPGLGFLLLFYFLVLRNAWRLAKSDEVETEIIGRMIITSIFGFAVTATFISIDGLEFPYYVALLCVAATKVRMWAISEDDVDGFDVAA